MTRPDRPRYSIVVPTRERHATLRACLQTIVDQRHDDFEIVVADNASGPETRAVCESFRTPRLRYLRSDTPLSMNDNWERGLDAARGEWVTFLGDDDGLMPYALREFDVLTATHDVRAIRWTNAVYTWPCLPIAAEANRLQVNRGRATRIVPWHRAVRRMMQRGGAAVPMIYYGLIHRSLIDEARRTGPVFAGLNPDLHSGVLFAALSRCFLDTAVPLTVAGLSGRSNGVAHLRPEKTPDNPIAREFARLNERAGFAFHEDLPEYVVNCGPIGGLDSVFRARDRLFPRDGRFHMPPERVATIYLGALSPDPQTRAEQCDKLRRFLARRAPAADFDSLLARHAGTAPPPQLIKKGGRPGRYGRWEVLDTTAHGVVDVAGAAALATRLLGHDRAPVRYAAWGGAGRRAWTRLGRSLAAGIADWRRRLAG
jgi:glycosyltransferase involved in cell wall biosynthesis